MQAEYCYSSQFYRNSKSRFLGTQNFTSGMSLKSALFPNNELYENGRYASYALNPHYLKGAVSY